MFAWIKSKGRAWIATVALIWALMAVTGVSFYKTFEIASDNRDAVKRLQVVEGEVQQIIQDSLLDCPNRAKARHVIREAILNDPDTTPEFAAVVNRDFKEIPCD